MVKSHKAKEDIKWYPLHLNTNIHIQIKNQEYLRHELKDLRKKSNRMVLDHPNINNPDKIVQLLRSIFKNYFYTKEDKRIFTILVKKVIHCSSKQEVIHVVYFRSRFTFLKWSDDKFIDKKEKEHFNYFIISSNIYILEKIVKPIIKHYFTQIHFKSFGKLHLMPKNEWLAFYSRACNQIFKSNPLYKTCSFLFGTLVIVMKNFETLNYRPIVTNCNNKKLKQIFQIFKTKIKEHLYQRKKQNGSLYKHWITFSKETCNRKLFGIKADIKNAFGSIKLTILINLLRYLNEKYKLFEVNDINKLRRFIVNQNVVLNKKNIRFQTGVLQGCSISPIINDLYLFYMIDYSIQSSNMKHYFYRRYVDDFIFISSDETHVDEFYECLKLRMQLNDLKISKSDVLTHAGYVFNLSNRNVTLAFNTFMHYPKMNNYLLNNYKNYIYLRMKYEYMKFYFNKLVFNTNYNNFSTIFEQYFKCMLFTAFKFNNVINELKNYNHTLNLKGICEKIENIVKTYCQATINLIRRNGGISLKNEPKFKENFLAIGYRAFILFLGRIKLYKQLICMLKKHSLNIHCKIYNLNIKYFLKLPQEFANTKMKKLC